MHVSGQPCWFRVSPSAGQCRVRTKLRSPIGARCWLLVTGIDHMDSIVDLDCEPGSHRDLIAIRSSLREKRVFDVGLTFRWLSCADKAACHQTCPHRTSWPERWRSGPLLLVLDEPTNHSDIRARCEVLDLIATSRLCGSSSTAAGECAQQASADHQCHHSRPEV